MNIPGAYSQKAREYAAYRPGYAPQALADLVEWTGLQADWVVADIGSGTGNLARSLLDCSGLVYAVEPEPAMRVEAERLLDGHRAFRSLAGSAESTGLADGSVDLITAGQALHWFDPEAAPREFARILRPPGRLALVWNRFGEGGEADLSSWFRPGTLRHGSYPVTIHETWEQYLGGQRSAAGSPNPGEPGYAGFERQQRQLFDSQVQDGLLAVHYTTGLAVGLLR
jgi:SAM-dependent methyltransferase